MKKIVKLKNKKNVFGKNFSSSKVSNSHKSNENLHNMNENSNIDYYGLLDKSYFVDMVNMANEDTIQGNLDFEKYEKWLDNGD